MRGYSENEDGDVVLGRKLKADILFGWLAACTVEEWLTAFSKLNSNCSACSRCHSRQNPLSVSGNPNLKRARWCTRAWSARHKIASTFFER